MGNTVTYSQDPHLLLSGNDDMVKAIIHKTIRLPPGMDISSIDFKKRVELYMDAINIKMANVLDIHAEDNIRLGFGLGLQIGYKLVDIGLTLGLGLALVLGLNLGVLLGANSK